MDYYICEMMEFLIENGSEEVLVPGVLDSFKNCYDRSIACAGSHVGTNFQRKIRQNLDKLTI